MLSLGTFAIWIKLMSIPTITLLGAGNMGGSLIRGLIQKGHPAKKIWAIDPDAPKLTRLKEQFHIQVTSDSALAINDSDIVILAIKPQGFDTLLPALKKEMTHSRPLILSVAAGITTAAIARYLDHPHAIIRAMPNMPALIGCGATALYPNEHVSKEQKQMATSILESVGIVVWVTNESQMDIVTALSGSGPAYFFLLIEVLQQCAEALGLPRDLSQLLTLQTALGSARMAMESQLDVALLRKQVTSPGGTTEKAILTLEENGFRELFSKALKSAKLRSEELASIADKK